MLEAKGVAVKIRVVVTGRSYHAAARLPAELEVDDGTDVDDALRSLAGHLPAEQSFPPSCLLIVSGQHLGTIAAHTARILREGDELALIAPVAGG